ncbi:MAG: hypothetical protein ACXWZT_09645 [Gaiellaceae bacterium]
MHGTKGGRKNVRRYYCSGRKQGTGCVQPVAKADVLGGQLAEYVRHFNPSPAVKRAVVRRLKAQATTNTDAEGARRRAIEGQLARAKDLYLLGDFTREQYEAHKRVLQAELATLEPPVFTDVATGGPYRCPRAALEGTHHPVLGRERVPPRLRVDRLALVRPVIGGHRQSPLFASVGEDPDELVPPLRCFGCYGVRQPKLDPPPGVPSAGGGSSSPVGVYLVLRLTRRRGFSGRLAQRDALPSCRGGRTRLQGHGQGEPGYFTTIRAKFDVPPDLHQVSRRQS